MEEKFTDKIECNGMSYEVFLGFHDYELNVKQRVTIDVIAYFSTGRFLKIEKPSDLSFDYFTANQAISKFVNDKHYELIEVLAKDLVNLLLESFAIDAVRLSLTKFPLDMPNVGSVRVSLFRERS